MAFVTAICGVAAAQPECRGTKVWCRGACRYPDECKAAPKPPPPKPPPPSPDVRDCANARQAATLQAWQSDLAKHPGGVCRHEAAVKIKELTKPVPAPEPVKPPPEKPEAVPPKPPLPPPAKPKPAPTPPPPPAGQGEPPPDTAAEGEISPLVYAGFGVAGLGLIIGSITGGISLDQQSTLKEECPDDICPPEKEDEVNTALAIGHVSTASFVIAGVGAAVGVVGLFIGGGDAAETETAALQPLVGPGYLGLTGKF